MLRLDRLTAYRFDNKKQKSSAVKCRQWQEIEMPIFMVMNAPSDSIVSISDDQSILPDWLSLSLSITLSIVSTIPTGPLRSFMEYFPLIRSAKEI